MQRTTEVRSRGGRRRPDAQASTARNWILGGCGLALAGWGVWGAASLPGLQAEEPRVAAAAPAGAAPAAGHKIDFRQQIQPILARQCVACHGPDKAEGGLRLTSEKSVFSEGDSGATPVVRGKPEESEIIRRILSDDPDVRMPPHGKPVAPAQAALLSQWIKQGADWRGHWAFDPVEKRTPPAAAEPEWVRSPIDAFVLAKLEAEGLSPNPEADKIAWLRRATFDLIGLPPTPAEVQSFVNDASPKAYEQVVDRLLASPQYGERWGRHWLDVVRFAETNSFERDGKKPHAWRFRDYVIRSLNEDKPYDRFLREQLAGDEIEGGGNDALTATGYYRLGLWDDEPADRPQARFDGLDDLVATTSQVFLGVTLNCARCHDHKIDPFTQKDYYSFLSFFHNVSDMANDGPRIERPLFSDESSKAKYDEAVKVLEAERNAAQLEVAAMERRLLAAYNAETIDAGAAARDLDDLEYRFFRDSWERLPKFDEIKFETEGKLPKGKFDIRLATRDTDFGFVFTGFLIVQKAGKYTFDLDSDDGSRLFVDGKEILNRDGIHGTGDPQRAEVELAAGRIPVRLEYFQKSHGKGLMVAWSGPGVPRRLLSADQGREGVEAASKDLRRLMNEVGERLLGKEAVADYRKKVKNLEELKRKRVPIDMALCVTEFGDQAPPTFVMVRGNPHSPGEKVEPKFPGVLKGGEPKIVKRKHSTGRRTALADWLLEPGNPLTARVMVNRVWQHHFGRGIVRSPNNFGLLGDPPTHPELLDWLAERFVAGGWKLKSLHKEMMLSSTYRMSTAHQDAGYAKDPMNNLFWKFDGRRLEAEEVRDAVLAVSGELNPAMYGPSVYPEISKEVLQGQSIPGNGWNLKETPENKARRSVYVHVKRSLILPILSDFDSADTDGSCAARFCTTQPTQALGMLNGKFTSDQAAVFARRLEREAGADAGNRIRRSIELAFSRPARPEEVERGVKLLSSLKEKHGATEERALELYCLVLLNQNEFVYLD